MDDLDGAVDDGGGVRLQNNLVVLEKGFNGEPWPFGTQCLRIYFQIGYHQLGYNDNQADKLVNNLNISKSIGYLTEMLCNN